MTKLSNVVDKFGVYTYKSDLLNFRVEDFRNWKHRELTVKKDFLAKTQLQRTSKFSGKETIPYKKRFLTEKEENGGERK